MKRNLWGLTLGCAVLLLFFQTAVFSPALAQDAIRVAVARLQAVNGEFIGTVSFTQVNANVVVVAQVAGLPAGIHGFHVHLTGECDAAGDKPFASAGSHLNPAENTHGNHAGDLPTLLVLDNGAGYMTTFTDRFSVADLLDTDGSAVIIHANPDNYANIPERYGTADEDTLATGDSGARIACGIVQAEATAWNPADTVAAFKALPLDLIPAAVSREEKAERGALIMTINALGGKQIMTQIISGAGGQIGTLTRDGDILTITFTEITYNVGGIQLPGGLSIAPQTIKLDPSQTSTLQINLATGEVTRNLHWLMTGTNVLYDGQDTVALGDTASAQVVELENLGNNQFAVRLITHWQTGLSLTTWTINGITVPSGQVDSVAEFDGRYLIDFNK